jgi:serine protease AprX
MVAFMSLVVAFAVPVATASADGGKGGGNGNSGKSGQDGWGKSSAAVPASLLAQAQANPNQVFRVIVQSRSRSSADAQNEVGNENGKTKRKFSTVGAVSADLTGKDLLKLVKHERVLAITPDVPVKTTDYKSNEVWRASTKVNALWQMVNALGISGPAPQAPAIAIIDSGVDTSKVADFGSRVVASVDITGNNNLTDENGHGTMVASLAAGASPAYPGVAQNAPIVSVKAANAAGQLFTSDIIAAADWVLANKATYNIRVVNMSLRTTSQSTFRFDPLDKAVERLWASGVVVVAAAGNNGNGASQRMWFAPGNDPFIITVGAVDTQGTVTPSDDVAPDWSAYGPTADGFQKPDIAAPGRYIVGAVPMGATLPTQGADRVLGPGYMWMSGTSMSAPIVSGAAAQILARHPGWSPDQVKGALLETASALPNTPDGSAGMGEVDASAAAALSNPPAANVALNQYVTNGSFDVDGWSAAVQSGQFQTDWLQTDWLQTDWLQTDWVE